MNQIDLNNRVAIITGSARSIGLAIAERFLASGARVALWDLDEDALKSAVSSLNADDKAVAVPVDISDADSVEKATAQTLESFGKIDILVNNAGIAGPTLPVIDYPVDQWRKVLDVNLTGVFLCSKFVGPAMVGQGYGRIVNLSSLAGKEGTPNAPAYSASKAGVIALTKSLGKELAMTGVLVNCVAPAALDTDMVANMDPAHVEIMLNKSPMGRLGTAEEAAAMVAWLSSEDCAFSTGGAFDLSGGRATY